jgi:hypothetical protein
VVRLGSASLMPIGGGGGAGGAGGSGYAMFGGPDLFSEVVPRHRRVSSGFGSGRSSAADSGGGPGRASSPGLSLLDHLAAEAAAAHHQQQHAGGAPPPPPPPPSRPGAGAAMPQQGGAQPGSGFGEQGFFHGEALFPQLPARGGPPGGAPGVLLPPRDAEGGYNPFL